MIGEILQLLTLLCLLIVCFRYARRTEDNLYLIFTALSFATLMLSDLYYLTHSHLREGMRVPFAANDIADFGMFLLMSSALSTALGRRRHRTGVTAAAMVFAAANVALWIGWSGEWVRDIFGGLSYGWFICVCFNSLYQTEALGRGGRSALWAACTLLIAVQAAGFFTPAGWKTRLELGATALLAAVELWLLLRFLLSLRRECSAEKALSLSFAGYMWVTVSMYMSEGAAYQVFVNTFTLHLLLILLAIRKKVKAA